MTSLFPALGLTGSTAHSFPGVPAALSVITEVPVASALKRLYWLEEGSTGDTFGGPWADSSGNAVSATKNDAGYVNPRRLAGGGFEVTDQHGFLWNTNLNCPASFTAIMVGRHTVSLAVEQFVAWFALAFQIPADVTAAITMDVNPFPVMRADGDGNAANENAHGFVDLDQVQIDSTDFVKMSNSLAPANLINVVSFRVDGPNGVIYIRSLSGGYAVWKSAALVNYWNSFSTDKILFGISPLGALRPATGEIHAFALYDAPIAWSTEQQTMRAMARRVAARGYTVFGYP